MTPKRRRISSRSSENSRWMASARSRWRVRIGVVVAVDLGDEADQLELEVGLARAIPRPGRAWSWPMSQPRTAAWASGGIRCRGGRRRPGRGRAGRPGVGRARAGRRPGSGPAGRAGACRPGSTRHWKRDEPIISGVAIGQRASAPRTGAAGSSRCRGRPGPRGRRPSAVRTRTHWTRVAEGLSIGHGAGRGAADEDQLGVSRSGSRGRSRGRG